MEKKKYITEQQVEAENDELQEKDVLYDCNNIEIIEEDIFAKEKIMVLTHFEQ